MATLNELQLLALLRNLGSVHHDHLEPNLVLCAKTLTLCWLVTGLVSSFPAVSAPWVPVLAGAPEAWPQLLSATSLGAGLWLLFGRWLRVAAFLQAVVIVMGLLSSQAAFGYHRLFVACFFLSVAAASRGWRAWLPRLQVAVLYLGAGVDKAVTATWRDGTFLASFITDLARFGRLWSPGGHVGAWNGGARALAALGGSVPWLPTALSLVIIALELFLAVSFALGLRSAAAGSLLLHASIMLVTGGTFGVFFHAGLAVALLVMPPVREPRLILGLAVALCLPVFSPPLGLACLAVVSVRARARPL
jgi:hypothetical protein